MNAGNMIALPVIVDCCLRIPDITFDLVTMLPAPKLLVRRVYTLYHHEVNLCDRDKPAKIPNSYDPRR